MTRSIAVLLGLPARIGRRFNQARSFTAFAKTNGLLYFGHVDARSDEHVPVRGFTMSARVRDDHYMTGTVHGRDVTVIRRTDAANMRGGLPMTWTIVGVKLEYPTPRALLMSHAHGRSVYEAAFISLVRSEHVSLNHELDARFLIYAKRADVEDLSERLSVDLVDTLVSRPEFDYEFDSDTLYIYGSNDDVTTKALTSQLTHALTLAEIYEKDLR